MRNELKQLMNDHPDLAKSVISGVLATVEDLLVSTSGGQIVNEWCDMIEDQSWNGSYVEMMCQEMMIEVTSRCNAILENAAESNGST